jgi:hypothetical protein
LTGHFTNMVSRSQLAIRSALQLVNRCEPIISRVSGKAYSLNDDELLEAASKRAGLTDFGDHPYRQGLRVLLESCREEAELNVIGRFATREYLVRLLTNLLYLERDRQRYPEIEKETISAPIFMVGLPRTGTTLLHELLAQDPEHRTPLTWEVMFPSSTLKSPVTEADRRALCARNLEWFHRMAPGFRQIHAVGADLPQECIAITAHVFQSFLFHTFKNVPSYQTWLNQHGYQESYRFHRQFLMQLQYFNGGGRWVLKAPGHLFGLADLIAEYPDAVIIQTHRDPLRVIGSFSSNTAVLRRAFSEVVDNHAIAADCLQQWSAALDQAMQVRDRASNRFIDVMYRDLETQPLEVVRLIYQAMGRELAPDVAEKMHRYLTENPKDRSGRHHYSLREFGLDTGWDAEKFEWYSRRFGIPDEPLAA